MFESRTVALALAMPAAPSLHSSGDARAMFPADAEHAAVHSVRLSPGDLDDGCDPVLAGARERLGELLCLEPSAETIAEVVSFLGSEIAPHDRVLVVRLLERHAAWIAACQQQAIVELADADTGGFSQSCERDDFADLELAAALRLSPVTASRRVEAARQLTGRLSATGDALRAGRITFWYAMSVVEALTPLDDEPAGGSKRSRWRTPSSSRWRGFARDCAAPSWPHSPGPPTSSMLTPSANAGSCSVPSRTGWRGCRSSLPHPKLLPRFGPLTIALGGKPAFR